MRRMTYLLPFLLLAATPALPGQFLADGRIVPDRRPPAIHRQPRPLPITLALHQVDAEIVDGVARTTLRQTFHNPNGVPLEATYLFPLPDDAAVDDFQLMMDGKMVPGEVLDRDKAEAIYTGIVRRQQDPALLEYMGRRLFKARIFPVPAGGGTEIKLSYHHVLHRDGGAVEFRYPFRTRTVTGAPVGKASVSVAIKSAEKFLTIYSPSHDVDVVKQGDREAKVSFESTQDPGDRDFVLVYGLASSGSVGSTLFSRAEQGGDGAFLLLIAPGDELTKGREVEKDVIFVVDTSGSMGGEKMEQAKQALSYCINRLGSGDRFNLVTFATESRVFKPGLTSVAAESRKEALEFVEGLVARGGTNINDALVSALSMSAEKDRVLMVIFITDGEPTIGETRTEAILKNVQQANKALTRLFVFGVGEDLKVDLLDALAEQNHGTREYVGSKESIEAKVSSFYDKIASPVLTDIAVQFDGATVRDVHPQRLPDLFRGSQLLVTGRYARPGPVAIRLKGKLHGEPVEHVFEHKLEDQGRRADFVPRLWAVRRVGYLIDQIRLNGESSELRDEVVRLGKHYGIVTPYTSYLVVEDGLAAAQPPGRPGVPGTPGQGGGGGRRGGGGGFGQPGEGGRAPVGGVAPSPRRQDAPASGLAPPPAPEAPLPADAVVRRLKDEQESAKKQGDDKGEFDRRKSEDAREALKRGYFRDAIALSKEIKSLRESRTGGGAGDALIRRVGGRTFLPRGPLWVELAVLDADPDTLVKNLKRIEAFSEEYFQLLKESPELAEILSLGENLIFKRGDSFVQIVPAPEDGRK